MKAMALSFTLIALAATECGAASSWTAMDTANATDIVNASVALEAICDRDSGQCQAAPVRSIESGICKAANSMFSRHSVSVSDAGAAFGCTP
jgi:hypothetical protein